MLSALPVCYLPNGSCAVFGGNGPVPLVLAATIPRLVQPHDNNTQLAKKRWYPAAEPMADGTVVVIGGFSIGVYINRNYPNIDPTYEGGVAEPTSSYEFYPARPQPLPILNFMANTSGLNSFALSYLMPSGKMFVQANYSTSEVHPILPIGFFH